VVGAQQTPFGEEGGGAASSEPAPAAVAFSSPEGDATGPVADPEEQLSDDEEESEEDLDLGVDEAEKDRTDQLIFS